MQGFAQDAVIDLSNLKEIPNARRRSSAVK